MLSLPSVANLCYPSSRRVPDRNGFNIRGARDAAPRARREDEVKVERRSEARLEYPAGYAD
jgi:hypothetical protein